MLPAHIPIVHRTHQQNGIGLALALMGVHHLHVMPTSQQAVGHGPRKFMVNSQVIPNGRSVLQRKKPVSRRAQASAILLPVQQLVHLVTAQCINVVVVLRWVTMEQPAVVVHLLLIVSLLIPRVPALWQ